MNQDKVKLEAMIDLHGVNTILDWLCEICCEKAEHVEGSYRDVALAKRWVDLAQAIDPGGIAQWL